MSDEQKSDANVSEASQAMPQAAAKAKRKIGPEFPPVKSAEEVNQQSAFTTPEQSKDTMGEGIPPVVRSVLELAHSIMVGYSSKFRACPGYQGGLFYRGKPYCMGCGFRDGSKPLEMDDKANHMRLKDPLNYGALTIPVTSMLLCQLHDDEIFDIDRPLVDYVPELGEKFDRMTARSILKYTTTLDENVILKDCGAKSWLPLLSLNACDATQRHVYQPLSKFLSAGSNQVIDGPQQRKNLLAYLSSSRMEKPRIKLLQKGRISHFSIAMLVAVVETQLKGQSFEDVMRKKIFEPCQAHAAGFGAPKLWRDPNDLFYKPSGQSLQHQKFKNPVPIGSINNCAPPLFNGSLNLFAPCEDFAKLLLMSVDTIRRARESLEIDNVTFPHYDFGVMFRPDKDEYCLIKPSTHGLDFVPSSASFRYNAEHDVGVFSVSNCGTRNGRMFSNLFAKVLQHLFLEHVMKQGIDPDKSTDDPKVEPHPKEKKLRKLSKEAAYESVFKKHDAHKRF